MNRSTAEIGTLLADFQAPDRANYPELAGLSRNDIYRDFFGGGGMYLMTHTRKSLFVLSARKL